jgi:predicted ribosome quality control (RQC) complex YloA/Tae2 family protein
LVVGRNEEENQKMQTFSREKDILLKVLGVPGPLSLLRGKFDEKDIEKAAGITVYYSKAKDLGKAEVTYRYADGDQRRSLSISPMPRVEIERVMINE